MSGSDEIIAINREIERIDKELLDLEKPFPVPDELSKPVYVPIRGGWWADNVVKDELAARRNLREEYGAEEKARIRQKLQLMEAKKVLKKQLKRLLSAPTRRLVNKAEPTNKRITNLKHGKQRSTRKVAIAKKLGNPLEYPTMNVKEARRALGDVSRSTIYRWADEGKLQRASLGKESGKRGRMLLKTESVKKMLDETSE
jgi:hypothetical protein